MSNAPFLDNITSPPASSLHEKGTLRVPGLFGTCLYWNNVDLIALQFPKTLYLTLAVSLPMTLHQPSCCRKYWLPVTLSDVVYHALLMLNRLIQSMQESVNDKSLSAHVKFTFQNLIV